MSEHSSWTHHNPVRIVSASLDTLAQYVTGDKILLVTTPGFVRRGVVERIRRILDSKQVAVWDGVKPNPDLRDLDTAAATLREHTIDCVIGLGGGSALDAAKVLANTLPTLPEFTLARTFIDKELTQWAPRLPLIAIPTTSGTGAEVTPFATVWDHINHKKYSLSGTFVYPDIAFLDSSLTLTLGEEDTLYPALDTISHALESLWNKNCTPVSRGLAFQSLSLSVKALPLVMLDLKNPEQRAILQVASLLAGLAISQTRTAIAHSISYPLTSHFGVPHGLACSFTLPVLLQDLTHRMAQGREEVNVLLSVEGLVKELDLQNKIQKYLKDRDILALLSEMATQDRIGNFLYEHQLSRENIIQKTLLRN